ncbi:hypothetical protein EZV62_023814 [Acer yangbiense]|uniref:DUF4283 domain-containing protein n=1 Tax=Acer yangbiense TaxID=1000413 RepID=A0A5C7H2T2_9ROSI|nr:hypothetical protein EZV62_023814 [Acer yangbiense]
MLATSLLGKVLLSKPVKKDGFRAVMRKIWRTKDEVEIKAIKDNVFAFHFNNLDDKRRIISGGPWSFNDTLIVLEEPEGKMDIHKMKFNKAKFWIQIHNASMIYMTKDIKRFLGSIIDLVSPTPQDLVDVEILPFKNKRERREEVLGSRYDVANDRFGLAQGPIINSVNKEASCVKGFSFSSFGHDVVSHYTGPPSGKVLI